MFFFGKKKHQPGFRGPDDEYTAEELERQADIEKRTFTKPSEFDPRHGTQNIPGAEKLSNN